MLLQALLDKDKMDITIFKKSVLDTEKKLNKYYFQYYGMSKKNRFLIAKKCCTYYLERNKNIIIC